MVYTGTFSTLTPCMHTHTHAHSHHAPSHHAHSHHAHSPHAHSPHAHSHHAHSHTCTLTPTYACLHTDQPKKKNYRKDKRKQRHLSVPLHLSSVHLLSYSSFIPLPPHSSSPSSLCPLILLPLIPPSPHSPPPHPSTPSSLHPLIPSPPHSLHLHVNTSHTAHRKECLEMHEREMERAFQIQEYVPHLVDHLTSPSSHLPRTVVSSFPDSIPVDWD